MAGFLTIVIRDQVILALRKSVRDNVEGQRVIILVCLDSDRVYFITQGSSQILIMACTHRPKSHLLLSISSRLS